MTMKLAHLMLAVTYLIQKTDVAGCTRSLPEVEEAVSTQAILHGHVDDPARGDQRLWLVHVKGYGTGRESAAVNPDEHGQRLKEVINNKEGRRGP